MSQPPRTPQRSQKDRTTAPARPGEYVQANLTYRRRRAPAAAGALVYAVLFLMVILVCLFVIVQSRRTDGEPEETRYVPIETTAPGTDTESDGGTIVETTAPIENDDPAFIGPPSTIRKPEAENVTVENTQIAVGDLILVNYEHPYVFPDSQPQTKLYGNKSSVYMLSRADISLNTSLFPIFDKMIVDFFTATGCSELLVTSGYRTYDFQSELYESRVASQGEEMAALYVAKPGYSEHHAGLAIDMVIFSGGQQYYFPEFDKAAWIIENAPDYGFILRYTEENQEITHCAPEPWHYRYVGTPHARLITDLNLSFEEYHDLLHSYTRDGTRLLIAADGTTSETDGLDLPSEGYMIYYVPASDGDTTDVPVPPDTAYEISGDNESGFLVTVRLG